MFGNMLKNLKCPVCLEGDLEYSQAETFKAFNDVFELEDIDAIVDGVIEQYLVFKCSNCGATPRLQFKEIERMARESLSKHIMTLKAAALAERATNAHHRYYVHCGYCTGFDGRGSCPKAIYEKCGLKKVPNGL